MKTIKLRNFAKSLMVLCLLLVSSKGFSQTAILFTVTNFVQTAPNTFRYDVMMTNTGTTAISVRGYSWGLNTATGIANGGAISQTYISRDASIDAAGVPVPTFAATAITTGVCANSYHLRFTTTNASGSGAPLVAGVPIRLGTVSVQTSATSFPSNFNPFTQCSTFTPIQLSATGGKTACVATCTITPPGTSSAISSITGLSATMTPNPAGASPFILNPPTACVPVITNVSAAACNTYTWATPTGNGNTYTASGTYSKATPQTANPACFDTTYLQLTINNSTTSSESQTACDSYTWAANGVTYTASGAYTNTSLNAAGCVNTATLNLTINNSTSSSLTQTSCDSYTWAANGVTYTAGGTYIHTSLNAAGCLNTATLNLTINNSSSSSMSDVACDSYTWAANGVSYNASGAYTSTSLNAAGCVNTATLNLTINNSSSSSMSASSCDSYTWAANGVTYTAGGTYTNTSLNASGCLNTATLNLTINNSTSSSSSQTACNSYTWAANGVTYTAGGTYIYTSLNAAGCVNTATLNLTINTSSSSSLSDVACDSYTWAANGVTYNASGAYTSTSLNAAGCVNTATLNLTINNSSSSSISASSCDSYTWAANGVTYTAGGSYTNTSLNAAGCLNAETLNLTVNSSTTNSSTITSPASYTWASNGVTYTASGAYTFTSLNAAGCLHTELLNLTITTSSFTLLVQEDMPISCFGSNDGAIVATATGPDTYTYSIDGGGFTNFDGSFTGVSAGTHTICATNGTFTLCNTITFVNPPALTMNLTIDSTVSCLSNDGQISALITGGTTDIQPYLTTWTNSNVPADTLNDQSLNMYALTISNLPIGTYHLMASDDNGCFITGSITLGTTPAIQVTASSTPITCNGGTSVIAASASGGEGTTILTINGSAISGNYVSGTYTITATDAKGCTGTTAIAISQPTLLSSTVNIQACDSYTWLLNGTTYTNNGTYTVTLSNSSNCDSVVSLNLNLNYSSSSSVSVTSCDSYVWIANGNTYSNTGTYTSTSLNASGCVHAASLNLTINNSSASSLTASSCDTYTWAADGMTYTVSGAYSFTSLNAAGCTNTDNLILTINNSTSVSSTVSGCDSYTWSCNGVVYTASGSYSCTSLNAAGCLNASTLNLTMNNSTSSTSSDVGCTSYTWAANGVVYNASGVYTATSLNAAGCAHTSTLNLTINQTTSNTTTASASGSYTWAVNGQTYLSSGSYTSTSLNAAGCLHTETLILTIAGTQCNFTLTIAEDQPISCWQYSDASLQATASPTGTYTYTCVSPSAQSSSNQSGYFANLEPGTHTVYASNGTCITSGTIYFVRPDSLNLTLVTDSMVSCLGNDGQLTACITGGTNVLQGYLTWWTKIGSSDTLNDVFSNNFALTLSNLSAGQYNVSVEDDRGCFYNETASILEAAPINVTVNFNSVSCYGGTTPVSVTGTGGVKYLPTADCLNPAAAVNSTLSFMVNGSPLVSSYSAGTYTLTATDAKGCTGTTIFTITQPALIATSSNATACDSYSWNGNTYTTSGAYATTYLASNGCDSVYTLNLTINNSSSNTSTIFACDSYTWNCNNATYTVSGAYSCTSLNAAGCVHTEMLALTVGYTAVTSNSVFACDAYTWNSNGITYTAAGTYSSTSINASGCTSTEILVLSMGNSTSNTTVASACDSYTWSCNNATYTTSGSYTCTSINGSGCLHTETLALTIGYVDVVNTTMSACDTYTWGVSGLTYTSSGMYTLTSLNASGCLHTENLNLSVNYSTSNSLTLSECDSYTWNCNNVTYTSTGIYSCTSLNTAGCPNSQTLHLTINYSSSNTMSAFGFLSYTWPLNGMTYSVSGNYTVTSMNAAGCIHSEILSLTIQGFCNFTLAVSEDQPISCNGNMDAALQATCSPSGTYTYTIVSPTAASVSNTNGYFNNLESGTHTIYATDGACVATQTIYFLNPAPLDISFSTDSMVSCLGNDGQMTISIAGGTNILQGYLTWWTKVGSPDTLNNVLTNNFALTLSNLTAGNYNVAIEDDHGCFYNETAAIQTASPIVVSASNTTFCHNGTTVITATANGGVSYPSAYTSTLTYQINGMPIASTYPAGNYTITATDSKGCTGSTVLLIANPTQITGTSSVTACNNYTWNGTTYTVSGVYTGTFTAADGCDSIYSLMLTINYPVATNTSFTWCDMYSWPATGQTYTVSGVYSNTMTTAAGCVDTAYLHLTILNSTISMSNVTACDSYTWSTNGVTYTTSGTYTYIGVAPSGCAAVYTLCVTIIPSAYSTISITACNSYNWLSNNATYTTSGTYTTSFLNATGCYQHDTLNLTINYNTSNSSSYTWCDAYTWPLSGQTYAASGVYTHTSTNGLGCMQTDSLYLTILNSTVVATCCITACDSYTWAQSGLTYTTSGNYFWLGQNAAGCTVFYTLNLEIYYNTTTNLTESACGSYTWPLNSVTYTVSGIYTGTSLNAAGCTNTSILDLTIVPGTFSSSVNATECDSYSWNGVTYTTSGVYTYTTLNASGCINTATLNLTVNYSSTTGSASETACDAYTWNGATYTTSGAYTYTTLNAVGCTNTATLNLTINNSSTNGNAAQVSCDAYTWNGATYTTSGTYTYTSLNAVGCTNTAILNLTVNYASTDGNASATSCDTYTWNGATYTTSGVYTYTSLNATGCTNTATLNLTINNSTTNGNSTVISCNVYSWNGATYTASGVYTYTTLNAFSCINMATLDLTVNYSSTNGNETQISCDSYIWNGATYTTSGIYTYTSLNAVGCSNTATLNLTVNYSSTNGNSAITSCDSYTWNGSIYTANGVYTYSSLNATGCTNTDSLTLTINNSSASSTSSTACNSYTWTNGVTYSTAGVYTYTAVNSSNCDSILTLNLVLNNGVSISAKVMLEGAFDVSTGLMKDSLRQVSHCASAQIGFPGVCPPVNVIPSTRLKWNAFNDVSCNLDADTTIGGGNVVIANNIMSVAGSNAIVDWVFLEVRDGIDNNTVVATKYALVQRDGDVVSCIDGVSPVYLSCVCPGNYYVSIKHRNHLGVMTAATMSLSATTSSYDFSDPMANVWVKPSVSPGDITNAPRHLIGNKSVLWGGDAVNDKNSKYNGLANDKQQIVVEFNNINTNNILYQVYRNSDMNMDGKVKYNSIDNDKNWLLNLILSSTAGTTNIATQNSTISQHTPN